jgi:trehalose 6-phosphate phosphatase
VLPPALRPLVDDPDGAALFLDFDGTLSSIVPAPAAARPLPGTVGILARLARRLRTVAVVSGRPAAFLADALAGRGGARLVGLYGLEEVDAAGAVRVPADVERWRPVVQAVTERARRDAPPGTEVEAKGLTVTLHWRGAPEARPWAEGLAAEVGAATGLVGQPGRMALELRPPLAVDKGTVVSDLAIGCRSAACFGDDLGDLPAFAALGALAAHGVAVARVAVVDAESPPDVAAAADVVVDGPAGALALLAELADGLG